MNEQICLSFTVMPDGTQSANFSIFPVMADGAMDVSGVRSILINGPSQDPADEAFVEAISAAIADFRSAKGI